MPDVTKTETSKLSRLMRSGAVGVVATIVDVLMLVLLVDGLGMPAPWANLPALSLGLLVQFAGNKYFAFEDRSSDRLVRQGTLFALVETGAFALNALAFHLLVTMAGTPYLVARALGSAGVYFAFSYPLWGLIFRPTPPSNAR